MRTTIDLPIQVRQQLSQEASVRNLKGFSVIIVEALHEYFRSKANDRKHVVSRLKGSLSKQEYAQAKQEFSQGRGKWRA